MLVRTLAAATLAAATACAQAQTAPEPAPPPPPSYSLHPFVAAGLTDGGDTLVTVRYSNGDTQRIKAGGVFEILAGLDYHEEGAPISLRASLGYHVDDTNARDGSVTFSRWPAELLLFWNTTQRVRLGLGARKALSPRLNSSGSANGSVGDIDFTSTVGGVFEGEFFPARQIGISLRFVSEKYKDDFGNRIDGSHVGIRAAWYF